MSKELKKALLLLITIAERYRRQAHAIEHNMYIGGVITISTTKHHKSYVEITEAINTIKEELGL